ncbi:MAG: amino acid--tRNA ligase-related protein [bacterium]|nr:amino acid--tRNA ligase-related protein [bacterium]
MQNKHFKAQNHINNLIEQDYYKNLISLRNTASCACDAYFQNLGAPKVDLYMIAKSVSSPMGKGSYSEPIPFNLGDQHVFLVDSAQFGMEPLVQRAYKMVYCYLPSFRGEDSDYRHLNQFYHCEAELRGDLYGAISTAESLVKSVLADVLIAFDKNKYKFENSNFDSIESIINKDFIKLTFDQGVKILKSKGLGSLIESHSYGRVITTRGEMELSKYVNSGKIPFWLTHYDRDAVPFYQKPAQNSNQVLNADLIFPSIKGSFGGEVLGLGQRQNSKEEMLESMKRQGIKDVNSYDWYLSMRERKDYQSTSGFGLGIERLLAWTLNLESIIDTAIYPVLKEEKVYY